MAQPTKPVNLSLEQIAELNQKLSTLRHDLNNSLSLIAATVALIRRLQLAGELGKRVADFAGLFGQCVPHLFGDRRPAALHIARP